MVHCIYKSFDGIILQCFYHSANIRESNNKEGVLRIWQYQHKYRAALAQQLTFVFGHNWSMRVQNIQLLNIIVLSDSSNPRNRDETIKTNSKTLNRAHLIKKTIN